MHTAIGHSSAVIVAGKFQKRQSTLGREQIKDAGILLVIVWVMK